MVLITFLIYGQAAKCQWRICRWRDGSLYKGYWKVFSSTDISKKPKKSGIKAILVNDKELGLLKKLVAWALAVKLISVMKIAPTAKAPLAGGIVLAAEVLIYVDYKIIRWKKQLIDCSIFDIYLVWYFQLLKKNLKKEKNSQISILIKKVVRGLIFIPDFYFLLKGFIKTPY